MGSISGAVALVQVERSAAVILFHDPNPVPFPSGAVLWNDPGPPTPAELVTRSMWLSLVNRSVSEHLEITVAFDDATSLATSLLLSSTVVDVAASTRLSTAAKRLDLVERFVAARAA